MKRINERFRIGTARDLHNSRPIDALSPTIHTPRSCLALQCRISHQSYSLYASVSKLTPRLLDAIQAQLFTVLCIFVTMVQSIIRSDTCALPPWVLMAKSSRHLGRLLSAQPWVLIRSNENFTANTSAKYYTNCFTIGGNSFSINQMIC